MDNTESTESTERPASLGRDAERKDPVQEFGAVRKDVAPPAVEKRKLLPKPESGE